MNSKSQTSSHSSKLHKCLSILINILVLSAKYHAINPCVFYPPNVDLILNNRPSAFWPPGGETESKRPTESSRCVCVWVNFSSVFRPKQNNTAQSRSSSFREGQHRQSVLFLIRKQFHTGHGAFRLIGVCGAHKHLHHRPVWLPGWLVERKKEHCFIVSGRRIFEHNRLLLPPDVSRCKHNNKKKKVLRMQMCLGEDIFAGVCACLSFVKAEFLLAGCGWTEGTAVPAAWRGTMIFFINILMIYQNTCQTNFESFRTYRSYAFQILHVFF